MAKSNCPDWRDGFFDTYWNGVLFLLHSLVKITCFCNNVLFMMLLVVWVLLWSRRIKWNLYLTLCRWAILIWNLLLVMCLIYRIQSITWLTQANVFILWQITILLMVLFLPLVLLLLVVHIARYWESSLNNVLLLAFISTYSWFFCSWLLWDLTSKIASTPTVTIVVDLVEIVGCYVVEMLVLSKWIFAFFWLWTLRLWWTWYFL
jgi:hypothetical protein